jgi:hypothetical protein
MKKILDAVSIEFSVRLMAYMRHQFGDVIDDVLAWRRGHHVFFAIRSHPWNVVKRIYRRFPVKESVPHQTEIVAARFLGVKQNKGNRWVSPQFTSGGTVHIAEFFEMLEGMAAYTFGDDG